MPEASTERTLTRKDVLHLMQWQNSSLYQHIKAGRFPKPCKFGKSSRWIYSEVMAAIKAAADARQ